VTSPTARLRAAIDAVERSPDPVRDVLGMVFRPFDVAAHHDAWRRLATLAGQGKLTSELVLYVHLPFCARVCGYCLLASRPSGGRERIRRYLQALEREMASMAPSIAPMSVATVHIGGGTPTLLTADELDRLLTQIRAHFSLAQGAPIGIEAHPATTTRDKLEVLARHGVGRVSFGVETFDPTVLRAVQRDDQTEAKVEAAIRAARDAKIPEVNIDLLAGLPHETVASFTRSVERALALAPDSMSVNRYLAESSPLAAYGYVPTKDEQRGVDAMLLAADERVFALRPPTLPRERLAAAGYGTQYVWDETERARAYFQSDMIGPASVLTLGHGVLGHQHGGSYYTSGVGLDAWIDGWLADRPPPPLVRPLSMRFERAFHLVDRLCRGRLTEAAFASVFHTPLMATFGDELRCLAEQGIVARDEGGAWARTGQGPASAAHLLAFLMEPTRADGADVAPRAASEATRMRVEVGPLDEALATIASLSRPRSTTEGSPVLELALTRALSADEASQLRVAAERSGLAIEIVRDVRDAALGQYRAIEAELPPSVLWCRIAMAAARASREREPIQLARE
jgi:hypothetical protein